MPEDIELTPYPGVYVADVLDRDEAVFAGGAGEDSIVRSSENAAVVEVNAMIFADRRELDRVAGGIGAWLGVYANNRALTLRSLIGAGDGGWVQEAAWAGFDPSRQVRSRVETRAVPARSEARPALRGRQRRERMPTGL